MFYRILGIELFDVLSTIYLGKLSISDPPITASPHFLFATLSFIRHSVSPSQQRLGPFLIEVDGARQIRRYHWPDILCLAQMVQVGIDDILPWMAVSRTRGCYWWPDQLRQANDTDIVCEGVSMIHNNCWCDVEWNFWSALRRSFCLGRHCHLMLNSLYISCLSDVHNHLFFVYCEQCEACRSN